MKSGTFALALCAMAMPGIAARAQPPIEAFAGLPQISDPQLSPDGTHLAVIREADGKPVAVVMSLDPKDQAKRIVVPSTDWIVQAVRWAKNDRAVIVAKKNEKFGSSGTMVTWQRAVVAPIDGSPMVMLLHGGNQVSTVNTTAILLDVDLDDSNAVYLPTANFDGHFRSYDTLMKADVRTGFALPVQGVAGSDTLQWIMDGHGNVVARLDYSRDPRAVHILVKQGNDWRDIWSHDVETADGTWDVALSEDGTGLILVEDTEGTRLLRYDLQKGGAPEPFYDSKGRNVRILRDVLSRRAIGVGYDDDVPHFEYFSPQMNALQRGLEQNFPGLTVFPVSMDLARDKVIAEVYGPTAPPVYYFVDRNTHQALKIGAAYPGLAASDLGVMRPYPYKARDGLEISAFLTLPPDKAPKNLPLVIMPHGGPEEHDVVDFDWFAQFLANRGYAVLQPNYRGSNGKGRGFMEAGFNQWGLKMQDDLGDGVAKLAADGIADPKRVCIVGATRYGGYAALAGAALTPELYACAVSYAGVSDLRKFITTQRLFQGEQSASVRYWQSRIGNPFTDSDRLASTSPALQAAKVNAPVLLIHGENDSTVPIAQSEAMNDALVGAGKTVRFIRIKGEDHYMVQADTRIRVLQETEAFLAANIGR